MQNLCKSPKKLCKAYFSTVFRLDAPKPAEGATNYTEELPGAKAGRGRGVVEVGEESRRSYLRVRRGRGD